MTDAEAVPKTGDLRVWYIPQVPMTSYEVLIPRRNGSTDAAYLEQAAFVLDAIVNFSIFEFENNIKPDYSDAAGIDRWEDDGENGFDWFTIDEEEYESD